MPVASQTLACVEFLDHWRRLPRHGLAPHTRTFLDHAPFVMMPYVFIHELTPGGLLTRYMGTGLVQRWQHDLTDTNFGAHLDQAARDGLMRTSRAVADRPCGLWQLGQFTTIAGRTMSFEALLLPLAVDPDKPARVVTFSQLIGDVPDNEPVSRFASAGQRHWLDIGAGVPDRSPD
ncbi:MAG: PAS domain-containing protein [Rhodospirillaceae bacterium]|nr:PAS domain-containing protein [Rhodospirillaceae bacterium]